MIVCGMLRHMTNTNPLDFEFVKFPSRLRQKLHISKHMTYFQILCKMKLQSGKSNSTIPISSNSLQIYAKKPHSQEKFPSFKMKC